MENRKFANALEVLEEHQRRGLKAGFCLVPFTSLILEPDGKVGSCRHKGCEFPVGNILEHSLDEIWNGQFIQEWRRQHLEGDIKICSTEVKHRLCHLCPDYNLLLDDVDIKIRQTQRPIRLGINFNGKCNLECQMCHIWEKQNGLYDQIGFWEKLPEYARDLREVELLSGEPFIQKDTYRLADLLGETNPDCLWTITTNCHWKLTDGIKKSMDKMRFKNLIVSIDSLVPRTYSKIRKNGRLPVVLENLDRLIEYEKERVVRGLSSLGIRVNFLYQIDNAKELKDSHVFENERRLKVFRTFCYEPRECSILSLSESERDALLDFYLENLSFEEISNSMRVILPIIESLSPLSRAYHVERLKNIRGPLE